MSNHFSADYLKFPGDDTRLDLTDVYAFRSTEDPGKTVLIIDSNPTVRPVLSAPAARTPENLNLTRPARGPAASAKQ